MGINDSRLKEEIPKKNEFVEELINENIKLMEENIKILLENRWLVEKLEELCRLNGLLVRCIKNRDIAG